MPECNTNISQPEDAKTLAAIPGVKSIRPSSYYKAPKSVFEYLIKLCIFTYSPRRPAQMQIVTDLNAASSPVGSESTLTMIVSPNLNWFQPCLS